MAMFHLFQVNGDHVDRLDSNGTIEAITQCVQYGHGRALENAEVDRAIKYLGHMGEPFPPVTNMQIYQALARRWLIVEGDTAETWLKDLMMGRRGPTPEELVMLIRGYLRFHKLQNMPMTQAQAMFWNYASRKDRAKAIDAVVLG